jgi:pyrimidine and pyridine-specific 5'-nucleotidase
VRMGRFSKWFYVWVLGLLGADACCSVMNFLGHEYVKEKTREMEDHNYEGEEEESSDEGDVSVDRSFILGA